MTEFCLLGNKRVSSVSFIQPLPLLYLRWNGRVCLWRGCSWAEVISLMYLGNNLTEIGFQVWYNFVVVVVVVVVVSSASRRRPGASSSFTLLKASQLRLDSTLSRHIYLRTYRWMCMLGLWHPSAHSISTGNDNKASAYVVAGSPTSTTFQGKYL